MIAIKNVSFSVNSDEEVIKQIICEKLGVETNRIVSYRFLRKSIDARKKSDVRFCANLGVTIDNIALPEEDIVAKCNDSSVSIFVPYKARPVKTARCNLPPVVCGAGPAGLFAALWLSYAGLKPILIERGADADTRIRKIEAFNSGGTLDVKANIQFGEGGAGTFSDGKLTTNIHDERCEAVLDTFYRCGAPEEILYLAKPHLGTDNLRDIVKNLRGEIIKNGGEVRFFTRLTDIQTQNARLRGVVVHKRAASALDDKHVFSSRLLERIKLDCLGERRAAYLLVELRKLSAERYSSLSAKSAAEIVKRRAELVRRFVEYKGALLAREALKPFATLLLLNGQKSLKHKARGGKPRESKRADKRASARHRRYGNIVLCTKRDEYPSQSALRPELRILFRGSSAFRKDGCRSRTGSSVFRTIGMSQAFRMQQPGNQAEHQ